MLLLNFDIVKPSKKFLLNYTLFRIGRLREWYGVGGGKDGGREERRDEGSNRWRVGVTEGRTERRRNGWTEGRMTNGRTVRRTKELTDGRTE